MSIGTKTSTYLNGHPRLRRVVQTAKYGAGIFLVSTALGGQPGLIPTLSAGYLFAYRYGRSSQEKMATPLAKNVLKYAVGVFGMLTILLSDSEKVVGSYLFSVLLVFAYCQSRQRKPTKQISN